VTPPSVIEVALDWQGLVEKVGLDEPEVPPGSAMKVKWHGLFDVGRMALPVDPLVVSL
jgi:hypothetical protein